MNTTAVITHTTVCGASFAHNDAMIYPLTPCCQASGTGSYVGDEPAVVCRSCYREVPAFYGDFADADQGAADVATFIADMTHGRCPQPHDCATDTVWNLTDRRQRIEDER